MGIEMFDLTGKRGVVNGGASGMGREFAKGLAACGMEVIVADIALEGAKQTAAEIIANGGKAQAMYMNAAEYESVEALGAKVKEYFGKIDVVLNSVGITGKAREGERHVDTWNRVVGTNLSGMFHCCEVFGEIMIAQGGGNIINIISMAATLVPPKAYPGRDGEYGLMSYASAKAGVRQLTKVLATHWAEYGVRVNGISPGYINTPLTAGPHSDPHVREQREKSIPMGYLADPEEVVSTVIYLASDASKYVNGVDIMVDGGCSCR